VVVGNIMEPQKFLEDMKESFAHKFKTKPEIIEGNMKAIERAMQEVQGL